MSKSDAITYPRMGILKILSDLTSEITPNRFVSSRPPAVGVHMKEFLLISLNRIETPGDTYQLTSGQIAIFVRDVSTENGSVENTFRLDELQQKVTSLFPIKTELFLATRPLLLPGGSDGAGFHSLIVKFNIRVHRAFDVHPTEIFKL